MRKGPVSGISWLQLIAGALAAMTSAWVASYLGVAGTVIGAAVGSLVASVASALYVRGLDRGTTLITESGSVVTRPRTSDAASDDESDVAVVVDGEAVPVEDAGRAFSWKRILVWTGLATATALVAIGGYELVTDSSFGNSDNPSIGRPWRDTGDSTPDDERDEPGQESEPTTQAPTDGPSDSAPSQAPTTAPPTSAPTPDPAPEPQTDATETPDPLTGQE